MHFAEPIVVVQEEQPLARASRAPTLRTLTSPRYSVVRTHPTMSHTGRTA